MDIGDEKRCLGEVDIGVLKARILSQEPDSCAASRLAEYPDLNRWIDSYDAGIT